MSDIAKHDRGMVCYERFIKGDESALREIIEMYGDGLFRYVNAYLKSEALSEDIVSDTFVALIVKRFRFRGQSSFKTYLYAIARNRALDCLRHERKYSKAPLDEHENMPSYAAAPDEAVMADEKNAALYRAIGKLPRQYGEIIALVYFDEMTLGEAARVIGVTAKKASNLMYRSKKALRAAMESEGFTYEDF